MSRTDYPILPKLDLEARLKELMLLALNGDPAAYEEFLVRTTDVARSFLTRLSISRATSHDRIEDAVQETLISIHRKRDLYLPEMPIIPWIHAIAKYRFIDYLRRESRQPVTTELDEQSEKIPAEGTPESQGADTEEILSTLGDQQREILLMAKVQELPLAEIAKKKKMSLSAVKVSIHRSIKALRKGLKGDAP